MAKRTGFGKQLKKLRETAGISQYELAKRAKVSGAALSRIESDKREPSWVTILKLARALNVPISDFDTGEDPRDDDTEPEPDETPEPEPAEKKKPRKR